MPLEPGRPESGQRIIIATHNPGKLAEFALLLAPYGLDCLSAAALDLPEPPEDAPDFAGNARIKAIAAAKASGYYAIADDSGLMVAAMANRPGIESARFAQASGGYPAAMAAIIEATQADNRAAFACAICLATPTAETFTYIGLCHGTITRIPRGRTGFGYDPIFLPANATHTFAEMDKPTKAAVSHRGRALRQFLAAHSRHPD